MNFVFLFRPLYKNYSLILQNVLESSFVYSTVNFYLFPFVGSVTVLVHFPEAQMSSSSPSLSVCTFVRFGCFAFGHLSSHIEGTDTVEVSTVNLNNYYSYCNNLIAFSLNFIEKLKLMCYFESQLRSRTFTWKVSFISLNLLCLT